MYMWHSPRHNFHFQIILYVLSALSFTSDICYISYDNLECKFHSEINRQYINRKISTNQYKTPSNFGNTLVYSHN